MEKAKLLATIFVVILGLSHCSPVQQQQLALNRDNQVANICTTRECIEVSYRILKAMNETVDPCDNFYQVIGARGAHYTIHTSNPVGSGLILGVSIFFLGQLRLHNVH